MCVPGAYAHIYVWEEHWVHTNEVEPHWFMCQAKVCCLLNLEFAFQTSGGQQTPNDWEALQVNVLLKAAMKRRLLTYSCICTHSCETEIKPTSPIRGSHQRWIRLDFYFLNRFSCSTLSLLYSSKKTWRPLRFDLSQQGRDQVAPFVFRNNQCCSAFCFHYDRLIGAGHDVHNNLPAPAHRWHDASSYHRLSDNTKALGVMAALWLYVVGRLGMGEWHESTSLYDRECSACLTKETSWKATFDAEWMTLKTGFASSIACWSFNKLLHPPTPPFTPPMPPPATRTSVPG